MRFGLFLGFCFLMIAPAMAQSLDFAGFDQPLAIEAENGLEWDQPNQIYRARGNVVVDQKDWRMNTDLLEVKYAQDEMGKTIVEKIAAIGNVFIQNASANLRGEQAEYLANENLFVMRGRGIQLKTATQTVTASEAMEYWLDKNIARARGNALVVQENQKLKARELTAYFTKDNGGEMVIQKMTAEGDVVLTTTRDVVRGNQAVYDAIQEMVTIQGDVKITREGNQLNGDYAEVNLKTGVSRLLSNPNAPQRVKGLFQLNQNKGEAE